MLSIMLVVTVIVPRFAAENKASKQSGKKSAVSKVEAGKDKKKQLYNKFGRGKEGAKENKIK